MRDTPHRIITELEDRLRRANKVIESSAPSYTVEELETLARGWIDSLKVGDTEQEVMNWRFSTFLAWLARREREMGDGRHSDGAS